MLDAAAAAGAPAARGATAAKASPHEGGWSGARPLPGPPDSRDIVHETDPAKVSHQGVRVGAAGVRVCTGRVLAPAATG